MKKNILILILTILLLNILIADVSATTVFLTSDNIVDSDVDKTILKSIKDNIEKMSNGKIKVEIDPQAPSPGEGTRAIEADTEVRIVLAACCAGSLYELSKYSANSTNQVIFINSGDFDLDTSKNLRRSWDDNFSNETFAGYNNPGKLLNKSGITYIQPVKNFTEEFPDGILNKNNDEVNQYIAKEIIKSINNYDNSSKTLDNNLIVHHKISVNEMARGSVKLYVGGIESDNETYNGYTAPQLLYLTSSYLNGNALEEPGDYENPSSPLKSSLFAEDSYSIYDYMKMAGIVKEYMDENHKAPDYINYEGAYLSYYDLQHNFAKLTKNHTDRKHMDFEKTYTFDKVNNSLILTFIPLLLIGIVLLSLILVVRKRNRRKRRPMKRGKYKR